MIPSRTSRALTEWTTPSAFNLHPGNIDDEPDLQLCETHFYIAGNHYFLHHLDYYILQLNSVRTIAYVKSQQNFWSFAEKALDVLQWKFMMYTRHLIYLNTTLWAHLQVK